MQWIWIETQAWLFSHASLILPFLIALWISWGDLRTRRIPNYLTCGTALTGIAYNFAVSGLGGLETAVLGLLLGIGLLTLPYLLGGMGAGDVKALGALGAWLGPTGTLYLFCYMAVAGGLMSLAVMVWKGLLWQKIRQAWAYLINLVLCPGRNKDAAPAPMPAIKGIPYGVAIALGMGMLLITGIG